MRVGLLIYGDLRQITGGYLYDRMLISYLEEKGDEVEVVSIPRKDYLGNVSNNFDENLYERLRGLDVDVLLQDELNHSSLFYLNQKLKGEVEYPLVSIVHHLSFLATREIERSEMYKYFEERYLRTLDGFVFNSRATRDDVISLVNEADGVVAYPGKDHISPKKVASPGDKEDLTILFVGNMHPHKGLDVLIKALSRVEGFSLKIVGKMGTDEGYSRHIRRMIREESLDSRVKLLGFVSEERLSNLYGSSDLLAVPSFYEGFGIVYVEALGHGLPVIASKKGGASEFITDGKQGFLIGPGDIDSLIECLEWIKENPEKLGDMSENARERFEELPSWNESMGKIRDYLNTMSG